MGHYDSCREAWDDESLRKVIISEYAVSAECYVANNDNHAVDMLGVYQKEKLKEKRKQGYRGWDDKEDCPQQHLSNLLHKAVEKGDPISVANYCAFLNVRGETILPFKD